MSTAPGLHPYTPKVTPGRVLLSLVGVVSSTGCYIADWNETHIYNARWPPHAKFHNGQTMSMGLCLGVCALYYLWRPLSPPPLNNATSSLGSKQQSALAGKTVPSDEALRHEERASLNVGTMLACLYWVTQLSAIWYPGSAGIDPEWDPTGKKFPQLWISGGLLAMAGVGRWLEARRLAA